LSVTWWIEPLAEGQHKLSVSGELDLASEQPFFEGVSAVLHEPETHGVVLDLTAVDFIDSSGVRALVRLRQAFASRVSLDGMSNRVRTVLEIAGLVDRLGVKGERMQPPDEDGDERT
jgi:anti-sigma B factor antagonist